MKLIDSDKFLQDMADLYRQAGWDEREVHFSLADLRSNIGMEDVILIPRREADTVPVKHGKWIFGSTLGHSWMKCSECCVSQDGQTLCFSSCPNCGARMVEE